jgi:phage gp36-like protein
MSYATAGDMRASFPERDLVQLTNEDPTSEEVNEEFLRRFLDDASAVIDSYIATRVTLPIEEPPVLLKHTCIDIAMYRMQSLRPLHDIEDARKRYEDALKTLVLINQGKLSLGPNVNGEEAPSAAQTVLTLPNGAGDALVHSEAAAHEGLGAIFTRGSLRGY